MPSNMTTLSPKPAAHTPISAGQFAEDLVTDAAAHLGAAISQTIPTDDRIIAEHVRAAHQLLETALKMMRATGAR